jgi:POT family proton-dependent oligopeptide transporter
MAIADRSGESPASVYQAFNPIYILIFGLAFTALWGFLAARRLEPSTPVKFALGLLQLGLGFGAFWYGAQHADARGMVSLNWLLLGYLLHTTGELCLSPVGLSMITKLSPRQLVSTVMGTWFLATAFSQYLAAIISQFTGVGGEGGEEPTIPVPIETVNVYGDVFGQIALVAIGCSVACFVLSPLLKRWMHEGVVVGDEG